MTAVQRYYDSGIKEICMAKKKQIVQLQTHYVYMTANN